VLSGPYDGTNAHGPLPFERRIARTQLADPPTIDLCRTIGTQFLATIGYVASIPDGQAAGECDLEVSKSSLGAADRGQVNLDVIVDENTQVLFGPRTAPPANIDGYGLYITRPVEASDPCSDDLTTNLIDVAITATPNDSNLSATTLCDLTHGAAVATAHALAGQVPVVSRAHTSQSLASQDLCAAIQASSVDALLSAYSFDLAFGTECEYVDDLSHFNWWIEIQYGLDSLARPQSTITVGGHAFQVFDDATDGYCRYYWQGPSIPGSFEHEQLSFIRTVTDSPRTMPSCDGVGPVAKQIVTALGRH